MRISELAKTKIKEYEGCRLTAYKCPAGILTIGYGHTKGVQSGMSITPEQADFYLNEDISLVEKQIRENMPQLPQCQYDAVVSFVFNLGWPKFSNSTLCRKIKANHNDPSIPAEIKRWVYASGQILPGLVKRRAWEAKRYIGK